MKIELKNIPIREIAKGYKDNEEEGVVGYNGKLDIRPIYQREFIYKDKQREAVIDTITKNFPLNVMYWALNKDGTFGMIDGQQRTISFCQYINGDFSFRDRFFSNLKDEEKDQIFFLKKGKLKKYHKLLIRMIFSLSLTYLILLFSRLLFKYFPPF